jgi:hypothetical protein
MIPYNSHLKLRSHLYLNHNHNLNLNPYQYQLSISEKAGSKLNGKDSSVRKIQFFSIGSAQVEGCQVIHSCFPTSTAPVNCYAFSNRRWGMGIPLVCSLWCPGESGWWWWGKLLRV